MERHGRFWPATDLAIASDHLLGTEGHDLNAMPAGGGDAIRIGPADWGSLNVVQTSDGPLFVYANDGRIVMRSGGGG